MILLLIFIVLLFLIIKNNLEHFYGLNCGKYKDFSGCSTNASCVWTIGTYGSEQCTNGDSRGPIFQEDAAQVYYLGNSVRLLPVINKKGNWFPSWFYPYYW